MRGLLVVAGVIVVLVLLLAILVEPAETRQAEPGPSPSGRSNVPGRAEDAGQEENSAFVCLALVGGTALLAGGVWADKYIRTGGARSPRAARTSRRKSPARMGL